MKIYISGRIDGVLNYREIFAEAAEKIRARGDEPFDPAALPQVEGKRPIDYLMEDLQELLQCQAIYMLPGWESSRGATIEKLVAAYAGIPTIEYYGGLK